MTSTTNTNCSSSSNSSEDSNSNSSCSNTTGGDDTNSMNNVEFFNKIEIEYNKIPLREGWQRYYQEIREKCDREANEKHFGTIESEKPHNRCLNRYRDVNPYDHSRIILHRGSVDYINANLVKLERADRKYILTQGPLSDTVGHFWLMVWEQETKAILMLNKLMEKKQIKCHLYWPDKIGTENALKLNDVKLMVEFLRCETYENFCRRWFKLTDVESNQSREIIQFHYTTWPDFGIPSSPVAFLQFLKQVRDSGALDPSVGPAVVHCSAGIGRSGTFCLVDCCLILIDKEGVDNVSVEDVLYELRRCRMGLIQTADQLYFSYQAIIKGIKLLKDTNSLVYNEQLIISNDDHQNELDETPPLPPPRTESLLPLAGSGPGGPLTLNLCGSQSKPLPNIPSSESFNDDLYGPCNNHLHQQQNNKDALNNFINNEKRSDTVTNRPLPPLPPLQQQNSLDRVHESESDENELIEPDDTDDDEEDYENIKNDNNVSDESAQNYGNNAIETSEVYDMKILNGYEDTINANKNAENDLKRRKRGERKANIEQKVNEIKRKQRESEDGKHSAKKRRSIATFVLASVLLGVICVYAYSKMG